LLNLNNFFGSFFKITSFFVPFVPKSQKTSPFACPGMSGLQPAVLASQPDDQPVAKDYHTSRHLSSKIGAMVASGAEKCRGTCVPPSEGFRKTLAAEAMRQIMNSEL
jgi:hypothetical protein